MVISLPMTRGMIVVAKGMLVRGIAIVMMRMHILALLMMSGITWHVTSHTQDWNRQQQA
jgi:hypothetical protein